MKVVPEVSISEACFSAHGFLSRLLPPRRSAGLVAGAPPVWVRGRWCCFSGRVRCFRVGSRGLPGGCTCQGPNHPLAYRDFPCSQVFAAPYGLCLFSGGLRTRFLPGRPPAPHRRGQFFIKISHCRFSAGSRLSDSLRLSIGSCHFPHSKVAFVEECVCRWAWQLRHRTSGGRLPRLKPLNEVNVSLLSRRYLLVFLWK